MIVNGESCHRLRVYQISQPKGYNAFAATDFLTGDKSHLSRLDGETEELTELSLP